VNTVTQPLVFDLVEWVATGPKSYAEVMDAWRTSCPRLTIWEDAVDQGLLVREQSTGSGSMVRVTPKGLRVLAAEGRSVPKHASEDAVALR